MAIKRTNILMAQRGNDKEGDEMEKDEIREIAAQGENKSTDRRVGNNSPNYKKGKRLKLMSLLMYAGLLPSHSLALINDKEMYLKRKAYFMEKEGTLIKDRIAGETAYRIKKMPQDADLVELSDACPKTYEFYEKNADTMLARMKGRTWKGDEKRMYRNAEVIMFCDRLPVAYALEEKGTLREKFKGNEYYTPQELLADSGGDFDEEKYEIELNKEFTFPIGGSRNNGVLFTRGGVYAIYNFSKWNMEFKGTAETYLLDYVNNIAIARDMSVDTSVIFLYHSDKILRELANPSVKHVKSVRKVTEVYGSAYALPLTKEGQALASFMCTPGWRDFMKSSFRVEQPSKTDDVDTDYLYRTDGIVRDADGTIRYVILFAVPDIKKLSRLMDTIENATDRSRFVIRCFDFQEEFIKSFMPEGVIIQTASFESFMEYANHLQKKGE